MRAPLSVSPLPHEIVVGTAIILWLFFSATPGAPASSLQRMYVVNEVSNSVSVVDLANLNTVAEVSTGTRPHHVNVDPQGRYFYVTVLFTEQSDDLLQIFDVNTNAFVASVITGHQPAQVVPDHTGDRLYVSNEAASTLSVISVPEFKVVETVKLKGRGPHGHVVTPDGRFVLTPNSRSGDVSMVDLAHHQVDRIELPSGARPMAMGITSDGKHAYVADVGLNQVYRIDVAQKTVVASLPVGKNPMQATVHPTRRVLYVPCMGSAAVYKVDLDDWRVEKVIPVGAGPVSVAYRADGRYVYVTLSGEKPKGRVAVIDTETDAVQSTFPVEDAPIGIAVLFGKNQGW